MRTGRLWTAVLLVSCLTGALAGRTSAQETGETQSSLITVATEAQEDLSETETEEDAEQAEGTWNLLLIGSDRRSDNWNGNSDTMILLTVNENVETVYLVSFMRDTAAQIPGYGTSKLNAAYAVGGAQLLEETLESNFGVHIDNYAAVDFEGIVAIIDELGGVDIEQTADEIKVTNAYVSSLCETWGLNASDYYVTEGQTHLNGLQALAYMRDRYVGNDQARTARQRNVLTSLAEQADLDDLSEVTDLTKTLLTYLDTDITLLDGLKLVKQIPDWEEYELVTDRVPYDELYTSSGEMLVPVQPDTNERLLNEIYATVQNQVDSDKYQ